MSWRADAIQASFARKWRFEAAHLDVPIIVPGRLNERWRAIVPPDRAPEGSDGTLGADDLEELMDQLEEIYPPDGTAVLAGEAKHCRQYQPGREPSCPAPPP